MKKKEEDICTYEKNGNQYQKSNNASSISLKE